MGGNSQCRSTSITHDINGYAYTTGYFGGTNDFNPDNGGLNITCVSTNIFITKHDSVGNLVWVQSIGSATAAGGGSSNDIAVDDWGNVYIVGNFSGIVDFDPDTGTYNLGPSYANSQAFIVKLNKHGKLKWAYGFSGLEGHNTTQSITIKNGKIWVTGSFEDTVDFDPGVGIHELASVDSSDIFWVQIDTSGNFISANSIGGPGSDAGTDIVIDGENNIVVTGIYSNDADMDPGTGSNLLNTQIYHDEYFICKYDSAGNFIWANPIHGIQDGYAHQVFVDTNNDIYTSGSFSNDLIFDFVATSDTLTAPFGVQDLYVLKMNGNGNFMWAKQIMGNDHSSIISTTLNNQLISITGQLWGRYDFDPGPDSLILNSDNPYDTFLSFIDTAGNFLGALQLEGAGYSWGTGLSIDHLNALYFTGLYTDSIDLDPSPFTQYLQVINTPNTANCLIIKYNLNSIGIENEYISLPVISYPNPFTDELNINTLTELNEASFEITDASGRYVKAYKNMNGKNHTINLGELNNGLYFMKIISQNRSATLKIIKN